MKRQVERSDILVHLELLSTDLYAVYTVLQNASAFPERTFSVDKCLAAVLKCCDACSSLVDRQARMDAASNVGNEAERSVQADGHGVGVRGDTYDPRDGETLTHAVIASTRPHSRSRRAGRRRR